MNKTQHGLGWQPDLPDFRDYTIENEKVSAVLAKSKALKALARSAPQKIDLSKWCSPIEDQGSLGSCTAQAGVALFEYYQRRAYGKHLDGSRLFLYKATRNLMGLAGDTGAYLRTTMAAMTLFGVPPESYWPYTISDYDIEPPAFCYAFADNYEATTYYRLDPYGTSPSDVLKSVKKFLAAGLPSMFGFTVYSSVWTAPDGEIPFPSWGDTVDGGHAVVAVGYDDKKKIGTKRGAFKIRNSWGTGWGDGGYGWIPYDYVKYGIATDFWSLVQAKFTDMAFFEEGPTAATRPELIEA